MSVSNLEETRGAETEGAALRYTCTCVGQGPRCNSLKLQVGHKTAYVKAGNGPEFFLVKDKYVFFLPHNLPERNEYLEIQGVL